MSIRQPFRRGLIACVLLSAALSSVALTLGRSRGVALVGRPLDVTIPLGLDNAGQAAELCPEADVFQGDTRVGAERVSVRVEPGTGVNASVRVLSSMPVDEPVVTIYLRLGCKERFTRRYVLLSEEPAEVPSFGSMVPPAPVPLPMPRSAPVRPATAPVAPAAATPAAGSEAAATAPPRRPARAAADRSRRVDADAPMSPRGAPAGRIETALPTPQQRAQPNPRPAARAAVRSGQSRLTVDMLDLAPERDPTLRSTAGLSGTPSTDEQVRAQAAALWRSINAQPEDVLRDLQRVQALENDVKGLRGLVSSNDQTLIELRGQLDQARQERTLTLAAIALLALLLAAVVVTWFLRRGERAGGADWWGRRDAATVAAEGGSAAAGTAPGTPPARAAGIDLRVDESMFESLKKPPRVPVMPSPAAVARNQPAKATPPPALTAASAIAGAPASAEQSNGPSSFSPGFQSSSMASMRMVKAEELVDIQQQADFFMSLGQTDQAIEVLESHIHNHSETSALVWLDLLAIYRALKRREDYELLRRDFQRVFNAEVPAYDATPTVSGGLEDYPRALTRIAALWPSPKVMDVIEESIFRKPGTGEAEPFDLEAYRELVMLYNLGREVVRPEGAVDEDLDSLPISSFNATAMQPLSVARRGSGHPSIQDTLPPDSMPLDTDSMMDSMPGQTGMGDIESMLLDDSDVDHSVGPRTTGNDFLDPQVPRPSPRLGLDIDLTAPSEPVRKDALDSNLVDFQLSEPGLDTDPEPGKPG